MFLLYLHHYICFFWTSQVVWVVKNTPANAEDIRDVGLIPGSGRSPGGEHGNPLQYSCLENPMDRGARLGTVQRVSKSQTWLSDFTFSVSYWVSQVAQWVKICLQCRWRRRRRFDPWVRKIPWRRAWEPTPVLLPGESHGQRSLVGYSSQGCKESDTTEAAWHSCTHANDLTLLIRQ